MRLLTHDDVEAMAEGLRLVREKAVEAAKAAGPGLPEVYAKALEAGRALDELRFAILKCDGEDFRTPARPRAA